MIQGIRLPPPVRPGDRIGVAALSGPVDPERLERGLTTLAALGFEPVPASNLGSRCGLFAGSEEERLRAFHELAADPSLKAIIFARGGWGLLPLLPHLDWALLAARPRAWVGYSDVVPFLLEAVRRLGLATFHGPMVAADLARGLTAEEEESFLGALAGDFPRVIPLAGAEGEGTVEGPLLGGCLSLLVSTLGTPWAADLEGALLFWEDVGEPAYRIDRMLTHMALSNTLGGIRGMIVGQVEAPEGEGAGGSWLERVRGLTAPAPGGQTWPFAWGLAAGHRAVNLTLPLGLPARLEPVARRLVLGCHA